MRGFRIKKGFLIILGLLFFGKLGWGQYEDIRFDSAPKNIVANAFILPFLQDSNGYIWFGGYGGLCRYDGYDLEWFHPNPYDSLSLTDGRINFIVEDKKGFLWIATQGGLNRFNLKTELFKRFKHNPSTNNLWEEQVQPIIQGEHLWIFTGEGLCKFNYEKDEFNHIYHESNNDKFTLDAFLYTYHPYVTQSDKLILINNNGLGFYFYDDQQDDFIYFQHDPEDINSLSNDTIRYILEDENGKILLGTISGLNEFDVATRKLTHLDEYPEYHYPMKDQIHGYQMRLADGTEWIGTNNGLYILNHHTDSYIQYQHEPNNPYSLSHQRTTLAFQDRSDIYWLSSNGEIDLYNPHKKKFYSVPFNVSTDFNPKVKMPFEIEPGKLLTYFGKGLKEIDLETGKINPFPYRPKEGSQYWVYETFTFFKDQSGKIWMGLWGGDVFVYNPNTHEFEFKELLEGFQREDGAKHFVVDILADKNGRVWVSTWANGVFRYESTTETFTHFSPNPKDSTSLISPNARVMFLDNEDTFWISTRGGLEKYDYETESFTHYYHDLMNPLSISSNTPFSFFESQNGDFWLGTYGGGLNKMDRETGQFKYYTTKDGLPDDNITFIYDDTDGNLWLGTFKGIVKFNPFEETFRTYTDKDGLINKGVNVFTNYRSPYSGYIFGGFDEGLDYFHPDSIKDNPIPPEIIITNLKLDNEEAPIARTKKQLNSNTEFFLGSHISHTQQLSIPPNKKVITFGFTAIHFESPENNEYAYQLVGFDKGWQKVGTKREATYTNLDPGRYTFKVKAANADGIWNETPAEITLIILPPWWLTWWAKLGYALTGIGALLWFVWLNRQKVKKKEAELAKERAYSQKLAKINRANQRFVPQDVLKILGKKSIEELKLGDQVQTKMTILFSDIRAYTSLSETMSPADNFKFINGYLGRVGPIIEKHGGFISQYFGDGLMALFLDNAENATHAAIEIQKTLQQYNRHRNTKRRSAIQTGIGLNTGQLMLGIIGDKNRYESTVIADAVNTASRMEGLTKIFGAAIILSEKTLIDLIKMEDNKQTSSSQKSKFSQLTIGDIAKMSPPSNPPFFAYRYLGKVKVKGREKALKIYDLYEGEIPTIRQLKAKTRPVFEKGIQLYFNKKFGKAADCFKEVLRDYPKDKAAQYYLDKSVNFIVHGVTENWSGVEEMVMK